MAGTTATTRRGSRSRAIARTAATTAAPARHVVLHPLHAVGGLDRDAAGVEGDALADQAQDRPVLPRPAAV